MFRLLLIFSLVYVLYKFGFFRVFTHSVKEQQPHQHFNRRPPNSNVTVDMPPKEKRNTKFEGGEYVDYEEVK
jgi:hypothetical protein